jgi:hypothetical protein
MMATSALVTLLRIKNELVGARKYHRRTHQL